MDGNHPTNEKATWFVFSLGVIAILIMLGHYLSPTFKKMRSETVAAAKQAVETTQPVFGHYRVYILYKVPECVVKYEIELRERSGQFHRINKSKTALLAFQPPDEHDFRYVSNDGCAGQTWFNKMIGTITTEFSGGGNFARDDKNSDIKAFQTARQFGANWIFQQESSTRNLKMIDSSSPDGFVALEADLREITNEDFMIDDSGDPKVSEKSK